METKARTIFIIDDDAFLLSMYDAKFKKAGFDVVMSGNSGEAMQRLKKGLSPDVITLDMVMPEMDGLQFLDEMRKNNLAPSAVVIVLTNQSQSVDIDQAKKYGIDGYIVKATTIPSEVVLEVEKIMEGKKR